MHSRVRASALAAPGRLRPIPSAPARNPAGERRRPPRPRPQAARPSATSWSSASPRADLRPCRKVLSALPANFPASIVIAQHMPQAFTGPFAKRLGRSVQDQREGGRAGRSPQARHCFCGAGGQAPAAQADGEPRGPGNQLGACQRPVQAVGQCAHLQRCRGRWPQGPWGSFSQGWATTAWKASAR